MSIRPRFVVVLLASALVSNLLAAQEPDATAAARPSLVFSTYLGGSGRAQTRPIAVAVDAAGYIYVTGRTEARDFPSVNAAQPRYGGGGNDAFVIKLTPDGQRIVYATFLGGGDREWGEKIATDSTGHAYIAGTTYSRNFPTTSGAAQKKFGGGDRDGFVAKLAPDGTLMYVTLLGGNGTDRATAIAVDTDGAAYVAGSTNSKRLASVAAGTGATAAGDGWDVLVARVDARGSAVDYAVRFGGTGDPAPPQAGGIGAEGATGIAIDSSGALWVSGFTDQSEFPVRNGVASAAPGQRDGFVARLDPRSGAVHTSTFFGADRTFVTSIAADRSGGLYAAGTADDDVVVVKLNARDLTVGYRTRIRTRGRERASGVAVDAFGRAHVIGTTSWRDFPSVNPLQQPGGDEDALVMSLAPDGRSMEFSTYLGGRVTDEAAGVSVDPSGALLVVGNTGYGDFAGFPLARALQNERRNTTSQGFVSKIAVPR
jgi:hypothetical protein